MAGARSYQAGDYATAAAAFENAYAEIPSPVLLYNIGLAYALAGDNARAAAALRGYLAAAGSDVPADRRTEIDAQILELERTQ